MRRSRTKRAFRQAVERKLRLARLKDALRREHPGACDVIDDVWQAFQHVGPDASLRRESGVVGQNPSPRSGP